MNLPPLKTLEKVQQEYFKLHAPLSYPVPSDLSSLKPSELNRLYSMISTSDGTTMPKYLRDLQAHLDSLPPKSPKRMKTTVDPNNMNDKNNLPRSRFVDQFYSHQLPGIENGAITDIRKLIEQQKLIRDTALNGEELIKMSIKKLADAYPEVSRAELGIAFPSHFTYQSDEQNNEQNSKIPKCPLRYMESSIAIVLEQTEHLSLDIIKNGFDK